MGGTVPLSEHEQRQLEQIEQALYADHPRLARAMRAKDPKVHYRRRVIEAAIGFVLGIGLVVAGIFLKYHWLAAVGLVFMLANCVWAVSSYRKMAGVVIGQRPRRDRDRGRGPDRDRRRGRAPQASNGLMERIEERWRRRQEGQR
jgi:hypothetical protein